MNGDKRSPTSGQRADDARLTTEKTCRALFTTRYQYKVLNDSLTRDRCTAKY